MTTSTDVPAIRKNALAKLGDGGYTIREAVTEAINDHDPHMSNTQREFIAELLTTGLNRYHTCSSCNGRLVGSERALGTCGHCGRRNK